MRIEPFIEAIAQETFRQVLEMDAPAILRPTKDASHGDFQLNGALPLAKRLKKNPRELAQPVAEALCAHEAIAEANVAGPGFINLRLSDAWVAAQLAEASSDRTRDGVPTVEKSETIVVDFSSPNIAKQMHVGHLRSTVIGESVVRMLRFVGHQVIGDNHLGDWGTQFGLLICGMREWGSQEALADNAIVELERVYKMASAKAKEDEAFAEAARAELAKLQSGDETNLALWREFVATTRTSLERIYQRLDAHFDEWLGESAYNEMLPGVVDSLLEKGLAREDQGAICVFFNELDDASKALRKQKVPFIVRKKDGAFLYSTSDIATVLYRKKEWNADRAVYVVDSRQGDHFKQLFEVMRLLGVDMRLDHIGFGMVLGENGKALKTRDGKAILLKDLLDEAESRAENKMRDELNLDPALAASLAGPVGIGAVKYADLGQNRLSNYQFDWEKLIAFKGNASPYLQYAHARCCSIMRKGEIDPASLDGQAIVLAHATEKSLARRLLRFADVVHQAAEQSMPHLIGEHLYDLARETSSFYTECPVLKSEEATRQSRVALVDLVRRQMKRGLDLLGIQAPERM